MHGINIARASGPEELVLQLVVATSKPTTMFS